MREQLKHMRTHNLSSLETILRCTSSACFTSDIHVSDIQRGSNLAKKNKYKKNIKSFLDMVAKTETITQLFANKSRFLPWLNSLEYSCVIFT